jgi:hypothetical protein
MSKETNGDLCHSTSVTREPRLASHEDCSASGGGQTPSLARGRGQEDTCSSRAIASVRPLSWISSLLLAVFVCPTRCQYLPAALTGVSTNTLTTDPTYIASPPTTAADFKDFGGTQQLFGFGSSDWYSKYCTRYSHLQLPWGSSRQKNTRCTDFFIFLRK